MLGNLLLPRVIAPVPKPPTWLRGDWRFSAGAGSKLYDQSRYRNHGTIVGADWTTGLLGYALDFNGSTDYVSIPDAPSLDIVPPMSIELVFTPDVVDADDGIIDKGDSTDSEWGLSLTSKRLRFWGAVYTIVGDNGTDLAVATRYHAVVTYDGATVIFYIDGEEDRTTWKVQTIATNAKPLYLGRYYSGGVYSFNGKLELVRPYGLVLAPSEVKARYNSLFRS